MRNESYNHHHQNFHHPRNGNTNTISNSTKSSSSIFLPILCRVSIKDSVHHPRLCPKKDDPSSPRVTCMGQVKRHHNNLMTPFPTPPSSATRSAAAAAIRPTKLNKIVSGKTLVTTTNTSITCRRTRRAPKCAISDHARDNSAAIVPLNLAELDPPLPVVKRVAQPCSGGERVSLWKRRSGGKGLRNLHIQSFQLQNNSCNFLPPPTPV